MLPSCTPCSLSSSRKFVHNTIDISTNRLRRLFLGAKRIFALTAIVLDFCFFCCFIAVIILTRHGASSCSGIVDTPLGRAPSNASAPGAGHYSYVCGLNTACFALAIINMVLFLISAPLQFLMMRHHQREQIPKTSKLDH